MDYSSESSADVTPPIVLPARALLFITYMRSPPLTSVILVSLELLYLLAVEETPVATTSGTSHSSASVKREMRR